MLAGWWRLLAERPVQLGATVVLLVYLGFAVSIDFPRAAHGFKGDEATYYSLAHSLARDGDFTFERHDLVRIWEEYHGPEGIFLKRGSVLDLQRTDRFPWIRLVQTPDPAEDRLYYGKSYIYPLFAAPFVRVFGTNGFLILHALLMALNFWVAGRFLLARGSAPWPAAAYAAAFLFATVVPVYFVWLMPELFNFSVVLYAYFLWLYKEVAPPTELEPGRLERFLRGHGSDYAAAVLLGIATFSKPTHVLLILPVLAMLVLRGHIRRVLLVGTCFAAVTAGLFGVNAATTGEFNYQGGDRKSFYSMTGFPFANPWETFDNRGHDFVTDQVPTDILVHRDTVTVLGWNLLYFVFGRYGGLLPYYFPGVLAVLLFVFARGGRPRWQWLVAGGIVLGAVALLLYMPYTYTGGGGPIGNRYYISFYPLFLFILPALRGFTPAIAATAVGALFTAKLVMNPFYTSFNPGEHPKAGPLRLLPIERTLLNDLPVSARPERSRRPLGGTPPVSAYFPDDGAYTPEGDAFWVRGGRRADVILRAATRPGSDGTPVPLRIRALQIEILNGATPNRVEVWSAGSRHRLDMAAGEVETVHLPLGRGVPYKPARFPTNYVYTFSVSTTRGFVPFLEDPTASDSRYLGAMIRVVPVYRNP